MGRHGHKPDDGSVKPVEIKLGDGTSRIGNGWIESEAGFRRVNFVVSIVDRIQSGKCVRTIDVGGGRDRGVSVVMKQTDCHTG